MKWPKTKDEHAYMKMRQLENTVKCKTNKAENWAAEELKKTGLKWKRQAQWGYRIFDFWNHKLGCAIEIDGKTHDKKYDAGRDSYNWKRSRLIVLRVRNFNAEDMEKVLNQVSGMKTWKERREP